MQRNETRKLEEPVKKVKKTNKKVTAREEHETQEVKTEEEV
jgi:hypothetical protein